jgi:hypothetical protein
VYLFNLTFYLFHNLESLLTVNHEDYGFCFHRGTIDRYGSLKGLQ